MEFGDIYGRFVPSGIFRRMKWPPCWAPPSRSSAVTKPRSVFPGSPWSRPSRRSWGLPVSALSGRAIMPPELTPVSGRRRTPILGSAACGEPIYSPGDGTSLSPWRTTFPAISLIAEGDSMIGDRIHSGDVVFLRSQDHVQDGEIAAVALDTSHVKHVRRLRGLDGKRRLYPAPPTRPTSPSRHRRGERAWCACWKSRRRAVHAVIFFLNLFCRIEISAC